jgi:hypothetical protein
LPRFDVADAEDSTTTIPLSALNTTNATTNGILTLRKEKR